jgi:hypothetical protein
LAATGDAPNTAIHLISKNTIGWAKFFGRLIPILSLR